MRIEKNQYGKLNFGLNINSAELEKALENAPHGIGKRMTKEVNAVRKKYQLLPGDCNLEVRQEGRKTDFVIRGQGGEADVYSSATENFNLEPGSLKKAFKGWVVDYMELRGNHDPEERRMIDAFGDNMEFKKALAKRKAQKDARSFQEYMYLNK